MKIIKIIGIICFIVAVIFVGTYFLPSKKIKISSLAGKEAVFENKEEEFFEDINSLEKKEEPLDSQLEKTEEKETGEVKKEEVTEKVTEEIKEEKKKDDSFKIIDKKVAFGFEFSSGRLIDTIIIHSSYNALGGDYYDLDKLIREYKEYGVSPHYLIDRGGKIYQLVADDNIAYHAGESQTPDGREGVNKFSLGIELMNTKTDDYTSSQYNSLKLLIAQIKKNYKIKYVLGHKDISPGRKDDPWQFNWKKID